MKFFTTMVAVGMLLASTVPAAASGSDATVTTEVTTSTVQIAEPFDLEIVVRAPRGTLANFPTVGDRLGDFDVIRYSDRLDVPDAIDSQLRTWSRRLRLETLETGQLEIPAMEITLTGQGQTTDRLRTRPRTIQVDSVLEDRADPTKFRDIRDVVDVETQTPTSFAWIGWVGASALGLAGLAGLAAARSRRKRWVTPGQWAKQELEQLRTDQFANGTPAELIGAIESIVRVYLENECEFPATAYTATQLLGELEQQHVPQAIRERIGSLFQIAEEAKFADLDLPHPELVEKIQSADVIIDDLEALFDMQKEEA